MTHGGSTPKCRFCGHGSGGQSICGETVYGGRAEQHFWQCGSCQMIYLYPPPTPEEEAAFYRKEFESFMTRRGALDKDWSSPEKHFRSNQAEVRRRMPWIEPYLSSGKSALEIGCSSGFMLAALKERGLRVWGLDPSEGFIDFVRAKQIPVYANRDDLLAAAPGPFDVILHYYVLEHVRDPVGFIGSWADLLAQNGKMIFEVPCANDPLISLYRVPAFDRFYWSAAHHWYFTPESLSAVLKQTGLHFELEPEQRYDLSNHMIWMRDGKPGGMGAYSDHFGEELERVYKARLKDHWLCDTIVAILHH